MPRVSPCVWRYLSLHTQCRVWYYSLFLEFGNLLWFMWYLSAFLYFIIP